MKSGAKLVAQTLKKVGIRSVFGVPGVNVLPVFDEITKDEDMQMIICKNESGASYMADGYAKMNGIGCCIGTTGPGISNMITGITCSYSDSIPVIAISAQVDEWEYGKYGIQEMTGVGRTPDMIAIMKSITKKQIRITYVEEISQQIMKAVSVALSGRPGPVYIEIPANILHSTYDGHEFSDMNLNIPEKKEEASIDKLKLKQITEKLKKAEYPVIIAGGGCRTLKYNEILNLAEKLSVPVAATASAKAFMNHESDYFIGIIGCYGNYCANRYLETADVVLALGTCFSYLSTSGWSLGLESKYLIRIDIDEEELSRNYIANIALNVDMHDVVPLLLIEAEENQNSHKIWNKITYLKNFSFEEMQSKVGYIDPIEAIQVINEFVDENTHMVIDVGQNAYWAERYLNIKSMNGYIYNGGFGAMGYGVAASIGVKMACNDNSYESRVICICGDGGFLMNGMELNTAAVYAANVVWIVFNNHVLGTQKAWVEKNGMHVNCDCTRFEPVACAASLGIEGKKVSNSYDLRQALKYATGLKYPFLIEVEIPSDKYPKPYYGEIVYKINR